MEGADSARVTSEVTLGSYGVQVLIVDTAGTGVCARLKEVLPPSLPDVGSGEPVLCYVLHRPEPAAAAGGESFHVVSDGHVHLRARSTDEVVEWLRGEIDRTVALRSRAGLFVHAGVVGWRGRAILVPGRSMTGKSSLVVELVRRGATYYSDEFAVLDDEGQVHPYARMPVLRNASVPTSPLPLQGLSRSVRHDPLPVSLIVSMTYREGAAWRPEVLRGVRAVLPIIDNTVLARSESGRTARLAARLAPTVATLQGPRPDAEIAARKILEFLDDLLEGRPPATPRIRHSAAVWEHRHGEGAEDGRVPVEVAPARYFLVENILAREEHSQLFDYVLAHEAAFTVSGVLSPDGTRVDPEVRRSGTMFDLGHVWDLFEKRLRRLLPLARKELGLAWFPVGRIERQLAVHQDGDFFGAHTDDGQEAVASRRLTCVYYFHGRPKGFTGGELRIYDGVVRAGRIEQARTYITVEPADNTAVFFPSGLFHEVRPVHRQGMGFRDSRFSINFWFSVGTYPAWIPGDTRREASLSPTPGS